MGRSPWIYLVRYLKDLGTSLGCLQARELDEGRFSFPCFDTKRRRVFEEPFWPTPAPGSLKEAIELADAAELDRLWRSRAEDPNRPKTMDAARDVRDADGTRGILDMRGIVTGPGEKFANIVVLPSEELKQHFGTDRPTGRTLAEYEAAGWGHSLDRGEGVAFVVYENDRPSEICFTGCSFD